MDAEAAARAFVDGYSRGWSTGDPDVIVALFTDDAVLRTQPFREPHVGREGVLAYTSENFEAESELEFRFGEPVAAGDRAAVEYWASWVEGGRALTIAGVSLLRFADDGRVAELRDYWAEHPERRPPPPGW